MTENQTQPASGGASGSEAGRCENCDILGPLSFSNLCAGCDRMIFPEGRDLAHGEPDLPDSWGQVPNSAAETICRFFDANYWRGRAKILERGLRIVANELPDPDRYATDEQIAKRYLAEADEPQNITEEDRP